MSIKNKGSYKRYNETILDRIDGMKSDKDFDPYKAEHKHSMNNERLFGDAVYMTEEEEEKEMENADNNEEGNSNLSLATVIIALICVLIVAAVGIFVMKNFVLS